MIDGETDYVMDFEVISNFCADCEKHVETNEEWFVLHAASSKYTKDFDGNSDAMETKAALRMWKRYVSNLKLRYAVMVPDGV